MPLVKAISTEMGIDATYWTVSAVKVDYTDNSVNFLLNGYATQAAKEAGSQPLARKPMGRTDLDLGTPITGTLTAWVETLAMMWDDFADAKQV